MDFAGDIDLQYADFGVEAVCTPAAGGAALPPVLVLFDQPGMAVIGDSVLATDYALRYRSSALPPVRRGDAFVIAGVRYTARESATPVLDGLEHMVPLGKG